jgi:hypothetical protein
MDSNDSFDQYQEYLDYNNEEAAKFNRIGKAIAAEEPNIEKIYLDNFTIGNEDYSYIRIDYKGGAFAVKNAAHNSLNASLRDLVGMLDSGHYEEVEKYNKLKKSLEKH